MSMQTDVAIIGGGLAGLATAIHLNRLGRRVVCIEEQTWPREIVGESLDFSAVALMEELGVSMASLLADEGAFDKRSIEIITPGADPVSLWPPTWFARRPIKCSMLALHVDRMVLDTKLAEIAVREGVAIIADRATEPGVEGDTVTEIATRDSGSIRARWYVDATGKSARMFGRRFGLDWKALGPKKVSQWTRFRTPPHNTATTFHIEHPKSDYLEWIWEIPLSPSEVSIGCVYSAETVKRLRQEGLDPREIFEARLRPFDRLAAMVARQPDYNLHTISFTAGVYRAPIGPNWLIVGDAAGLADPLTSNGVTASLRHAKLAATLIHDRLDHGAPTRTERWIYRQSTEAMVRALVRGIEGLVYGASIRQWLGIRMAVILYAFLGIITNSVYSSLKPVTLGRAMALSSVYAVGRSWVFAWKNLGRGLRRVPRGG